MFAGTIKSRRPGGGYSEVPSSEEEQKPLEAGPVQQINIQLRALATIGFAFAIIELLMVFLLVVLMISLQHAAHGENHLLVQLHFFHRESFIPLQISRQGPRISLTLLFLVALLLAASIKLKIAIDALAFLLSKASTSMHESTLVHLIIQRLHYQTLLGSSLVTSLLSLPILLCAGFGQLAWIIPAFFVTLIGRLLLLAFTQTRILHGILREKGHRFTRVLYALPIYLCEGLCLMGGLAGGSFPWLMGIYATANPSLPEGGNQGRVLNFISLYSAMGLVLALTHMIPLTFSMGPGKGWFRAKVLDTVMIALYEMLFFVLVVRELYVSQAFNPSLVVDVLN